MRCPKMCKTKWKKGDLRGFALSDINTKIGDTKQIYSVLPASKYEEKMLAGIMDAVNQEADAADVVIDGWEQILAEGRDIFFVDMYNEDVESRSSDWKQRVVGGEEAEDNMVSDSKEKMQKLEGEVKELKKAVADWLPRIQKLENMNMGKHYDMRESKTDENKAEDLLEEGGKSKFNLSPKKKKSRKSKPVEDDKQEGETEVENKVDQKQPFPRKGYMTRSKCAA